MWKVYDNDDDNDGQHQKFWSEKLPWAFGSGELKMDKWDLKFSHKPHSIYKLSPMGEYWIFSRKLIIKAANLINNILIFTMSEVTGPNGWERERERERERDCFHWAYGEQQRCSNQDQTQVKLEILWAMLTK